MSRSVYRIASAIVIFGFATAAAARAAEPSAYQAGLSAAGGAAGHEQPLPERLVDGRPAH